MQSLSLTRLELPYSDAIIEQNITYSQDPTIADCSLNRRLPMVVDSPIETLPCEQRLQYDDGIDEELDHFEPGPDNRERKRKKPWWQRIFG